MSQNILKESTISETNSVINTTILNTIGVYYNIVSDQKDVFLTDSSDIESDDMLEEPAFLQEQKEISGAM